jgi:hypothetical protein
MRIPTRVLGVAVASAALLTVGMTPAMAADGHVSVHVVSPQGGDAGGSTYADLNFTSARQVVYNNWSINDTCPGDGYRVLGRARALLANGTWALGTWHEDAGTCESDAWGPYDNKELNTSSNIVKAGLEVCIDLGATMKCKTEYLPR